MVETSAIDVIADISMAWFLIKPTFNFIMIASFLCGVEGEEVMTESGEDLLITLCHDKESNEFIWLEEL